MIMEADKLKILKQTRARKLGTLTRTRRRAFILIEAKGSRTELARVLRELDVLFEAVQEAHDNVVAQLAEEEDIDTAQKYIYDVEKQYSDAVERIREHLEARKDEASSVATRDSRLSGSRGSERSELTKVREAEIQERVKKMELSQMQQRLQIEQQEQELKRKRLLQEASDAHQRATLEASLQKAALDDLQWDRRNDFRDMPGAAEQDGEMRCDQFTSSKKALDVGATSEGKTTGGRCCAAVSKGIPKLSLPQFSGNSLDWPQWFGLFCALVDDQDSLSKTEKMVHLQASVTGLARKTIAGFMYSPDLYSDALAALQERFGRKRDVVRAHLGAMFGVPRRSVASAAALEELYTNVNCTVTVLQSLHCDGDLQSHENLQRVVEKLPDDLRREWSKYELDSGLSSPSLAIFSKWLGGQVRVALNCVEPNSLTVERKTPSKRVTLTTATDRVTCVCCDGPHHLVACSVFNNWPVNSRAQFVADRGLCFVCLQHGHLIRTCRWARPCGKDGCSMRHHELLHGSDRIVRRQWSASDSRQPVDTTKRPPSANDFQETTQVEPAVHRTVATSFPINEESETLLQIVPVRIHGEGNAFEDVFALLDPGSQTSLCTADVLTSLNITGTPSELCLQNVEGSGRPQGSQKVKLMVSPRAGDQAAIEVPEAFSVPKLNVAPPQISSEQKCKWEHTFNLDLPDYRGVEIKLLLGANVIEAVLQQEVRIGKPGQPVAVRTAFGWTLTGTVKGLIPGRLRQVMFIRKGPVEQDLTAAVEDWWKTESFGVKIEQPSARSLDEARAEKIMKDTTRMVEEGRYETGLLWKGTDTELPNNRDMAFRRLQQLERGLLRQPVKADQYQKIIDDYLDRGFARRVPDEELLNYHPRRWYLPHHGVTNPNKPGKLRLVFDAAASFQGTSLNNELLAGPDMLLSLPGVLLRFREDAVAIVGDIEKMYHQVRVIPDDQPALSFLWRDLDLEKPPESFNMTVTIFGARCSPASANYVLCKTAADHQEDTTISRKAAAAIQRNVYMDDLLRTEKTVADAKAMRREVTKLASKGGFKLTKWRSNSTEVLCDVPENERACEGTERPVENVLGCPWNPVEDTLGVRAFGVEATQQVTKRYVVATVARLFDPLGLAAPYSLQAKLLVQRLWAQGLDWDEQLKEPELRIWNVWTSELPRMSDLVVRRCLHPSGGDQQRHEVHIFCDASEAAFGAVAFLRTQEAGQIHVNFIAAKTRVAPLKQISIVRLELQAAVMASRLADTIVRELTYEIHRIVFWSDSVVVLKYLNNESRRFHTFVANRIAEIRESSDPCQWKKVPTHLNPADACSRGQSLTDLLIEPRWLKGPEFLHEEEDEWPPQDAVDKLNSSDPEVRSTYAAAVSNTPREYLPDSAKYSSWLKYRRVVAWMIRFVRNLQLKRKSSDQKLITGPLAAAELEAAEMIIIRDLQSRHFGQEIRSLKEGNPVSRSSFIRSVTPFLDNEGILRVGGRLGNAPLAFASRHPALLPSSDQVTYLIITDAHCQVLHAGMERTLTEVRQHYWPFRGRSLVKRVIHKCRQCKRRRCAPQIPRMADLPATRFDEARAFSTVGVDYFGPMEVKRFRKTEKRYGVLFTCCATRAVHLELAHSLDTDSFLLALRRFIARRGRPKTLMSDNGTNFVGGEREMRESLAEWEQSKIVDELSQKGIEWMFLPPGAPHMGGVWERLVGSVKRALKIVVGNMCLTDEVLHTVLTEVESMLNGRPLTYVSMDGRDPDPLTPNHLLLGCANVNLSPGRFQEKEVNSRKRWRQAQSIADHFWNRWRREYLPSLMARSKWHEDRRGLQVGDVVLMAEESAPRGFWPLARVTKVYAGEDGRVRSAELKTASGSYYRRPVTKICVLEEVDECRN